MKYNSAALVARFLDIAEMLKLSTERKSFSRSNELVLTHPELPGKGRPGQTGSCAASGQGFPPDFADSPDPASPEESPPKII